MKFFRHKGRKLLSVFKKSGQKIRRVRNILDAHQKIFFERKIHQLELQRKMDENREEIGPSASQNKITQGDPTSRLEFCHKLGFSGLPLIADDLIIVILTVSKTIYSVKM